MRNVNGITINDIYGVQVAHSRSSQKGNWFSPDSMRFWACRVGEAVYGGRYFVTSENNFDNVRAYSIRELNDDGTISTVAFQIYNSRSAAHRAAKIIARFS